MSDKSMYLYVKTSQSDFDFSEFVSAFARHGIWLEHPEYDTIKAISSFGDISDCSRSELTDSIASNTEVRFQWWFDKESDLYCRISFQSDQTIIDLALDGVEPEHESLLLSCLLDILKVYVMRNILYGFIIDQTGYGSEYIGDHMFH